MLGQITAEHEPNALRRALAALGVVAAAGTLAEGGLGIALLVEGQYAIGSLLTAVTIPTAW